MSTKDKYNKSLKTMKQLFTIFLISAATAVMSYLYNVFYYAIKIGLDNSPLNSCGGGWHCLNDPGNWIHGFLTMGLEFINLGLFAIFYISLVLSIVMIVIMMLYLIVVIHYKEKIKLENKQE